MFPFFRLYPNPLWSPSHSQFTKHRRLSIRDITTPRHARRSTLSRLLRLQRVLLSMYGLYGSVPQNSSTCVFKTCINAEGIGCKEKKTGTPTLQDVDACALSMLQLSYARTLYDGACTMDDEMALQTVLSRYYSLHDTCSCEKTDMHSKFLKERDKRHCR